jgi:hypothetical protein
VKSVAVLLGLIALSGCELTKHKTDPTVFHCAVECIECQQILVDCFVTGDGGEADTVKIDGQ